jgi:hypothetical protein
MKVVAVLEKTPRAKKVKPSKRFIFLKSYNALFKDTHTGKHWEIASINHKTLEITLKPWQVTWTPRESKDGYNASHGITIGKSPDTRRSYWKATKADILAKVTDNPDGWHVGMNVDHAYGQLVVSGNGLRMDVFRVSASEAVQAEIHRGGFDTHMPIEIPIERFGISRHANVLLPVQDFIKVLDQHVAEFDDPFTSMESGKIVLKWIR